MVALTNYAFTDDTDDTDLNSKSKEKSKSKVRIMGYDAEID